MNNEINDGGSAFPSSETIEMWNDDKADYVLNRYPVGGMSLRDYFAAVALRNCNHQGSVEWLASEAYRLADAMLAARERK